MDLYNFVPHLSFTSDLEEREHVDTRNIFRADLPLQFVRKSVEGLSMFLFIFAFLGNTFYVSSILTSPKLAVPGPGASAYIRESIP